MRARPASLVLSALAALLAGHASAATIRVAPVRVDVAPGKQFCALTVGNDADRPVSVQVRGYAWSRDEAGNDALDPTAGPAVNPPIATIPAGGSRLIRCSLPAGRPGTAPPTTREEQWRLVVDELPSNGPQVQGTVQTLLRLSIPVFRTPAHAAPRLTWSMTRTTEGKPALRLVNAGNAHAKILSLQLTAANGNRQTLTRTFYLLAGGALVLPLDQAPAGSLSAVSVESDVGHLDADLGERVGAGASDLQGQVPRDSVPRPTPRR